MSSQVITNSYHFGSHIVTFKSITKCHVISKRDDTKKIIFYDILDESDIPLVRVQCSVKYIIVLFIENKNGYILNKKTHDIERFSFDEFDIEDFNNNSLISYWKKFRISEYNKSGVVYYFKYNDNGELVSVLENKAEDQMIDLTTYQDVTEKDIPIKLMDGIFMHQVGGIVYAEKIA